MWTSSSKTSVSGELTTSSASWGTEDKEDQGKVNILACEGHHFNAEYFPKGLSVGYPDQSRARRVLGWQGCTPQQELKQQTEVIYGDLRNTNQGQCWYSRLASHSQSRRGIHVAHTACCKCSPESPIVSCLISVMCHTVLYVSCIIDTVN